MKEQAWLIGAGPMGLEHARVLLALGYPFTIIDRGAITPDAFAQKLGQPLPGPFINSSLRDFLGNAPEPPGFAIVCTTEDQLKDVALDLLAFGLKRILLEKPGGLSRAEIREIAREARAREAFVCIGYNRRFYASVQKALEIIEQDGGVRSFNFEFTEWRHVIEQVDKNATIKKAWFLVNSSHVVDLAFFLGGKPKDLHALTWGALPWHPSASTFCGAGISQKDALFSYHADWDAPGRWGVEVLTANHRLILRPLEKLQIQAKRSIKTSLVDIDDSLDARYKPGLYRQLSGFLERRSPHLCTVHDHLQAMEFYLEIAGYNE